MRGSILSIAAFTFILSLVGSTTAANLIVNPSFEVPEPTNDSDPTQFGDWTDELSAIVGAEQGITPRTGQYMLSFLGAALQGAGPGEGGSSVAQLVDLSPYAGLIATGNARINAAAFFNRVDLDAQTDTQFFLTITAYTGLPANFPATKSVFLARAQMSVITDDDLATWELLSASLNLPVGTDYVDVRLIAFENVFGDSTLPEFDGHYADDVFVSIVPEPATSAALAVVALALYRKRP